MVIGFLAPFMHLLWKRLTNATPGISRRDFLRVAVGGRPARSPEGLGRMTYLCGVPHGQMAKVEPRETVRKELLREWLGTLPSMRKAYQTDLSDAEWSYT